MEVRAVSKYVRISPTKVQKLVGAIKGKPVELGMQKLQFMPQKAAGILEKILRSAVANADQNADIDVDLLVIRNIILNQRKMQLIKKVRQDIYENAIQYKDFEVYYNE